MMLSTIFEKPVALAFFTNPHEVDPIDWNNLEPESYELEKRLEAFPRRL